MMTIKYDRVAADLRSRIAAGEFTARLPSETDLMERYGVSLSTVRRALDVLDAEELITRQHGTGTYVRERRQRIRRSPERYQWEKDRARLPADQRQTTGATEFDTGLVLDDLEFDARYERVAASADLAAALSVRTGTALLRREYRTRKTGERAPLGIAVSHLVLSLIKANPDLLDAAHEPWPGGTTHQLSTVGIEIDRVEDVVTARPASADEAEILDVRPGTPVLALRKICTDTTGRVVEVADAAWPGDRIELRYLNQLTRWPA